MRRNTLWCCLFTSVVIATLSSLGVEDSGQLLRGSAYAGAAIVGLYLARRSEFCTHLLNPISPLSSPLLPLIPLPLSHTTGSMFLKVLYPLVGVGLVGGAIHREQMYTNYQKITGGYRWGRQNWQTKGNLERNIQSQLGDMESDRNASGRKLD